MQPLSPSGFAAPRALIVAGLCLALLQGCGWPRVHKVVVQQGNVISQSMVDKLKPGMTRSQVAYIMGEPVVRNTFNDDRWDYVYTIYNPGVFDRQATMSLFFENDLLAYFRGDFVPTGEQDAATEATADVADPAANDEDAPGR
ncbi:MAG: outer membrane protein assembly factor BamE [Pseudomonadota bacterium]